MDSIQITLTGSESEHPEFRDIVEFLWDFNILYETPRLAVDPKYEEFKFTHYVFTRNGRPIRREDRLRLIALQHESPLKLKTAVPLSVGAAAALWAIAQTARMAHTWEMDDQKLAADIRKTQVDARKTAVETRKIELEIDKLEDEKRARQQTPVQKTESMQEAPKEVVRAFGQPSPETSANDAALKTFRSRVESRQASDEIGSVINRLIRSPIKIEDVEVRVVTDESE